MSSRLGQHEPVEYISLISVTGARGFWLSPSKYLYSICLEQRFSMNIASQMELKRTMREFTSLGSTEFEDCFTCLSRYLLLNLACGQKMEMPQTCVSHIQPQNGSHLMPWCTFPAEDTRWHVKPQAVILERHVTSKSDSTSFEST